MAAKDKCYAWGDWTPCSAACGPGEQSQSGTSKGGVKDCPETSTRFQACELRPCVSSIFIVSGAAGDKKDTVNPNSKVVLGSDVTSLSSYDGLHFAWSGGGNGLDLDLVNESGDLPSWLASPATNKVLVFNPGALAAGSIYTFAATVSNTFGMSSTTQVGGATALGTEASGLTDKSLNNMHLLPHAHTQTFCSTRQQCADGRGFGSDAFERVRLKGGLSASSLWLDGRRRRLPFDVHI